MNSMLKIAYEAGIEQALKEAGISGWLTRRTHQLGDLKNLIPFRSAGAVAQRDMAVARSLDAAKNSLKLKQEAEMIHAANAAADRGARAGRSGMRARLDGMDGAAIDQFAAGLHPEQLAKRQASEAAAKAKKAKEISDAQAILQGHGVNTPKPQTPSHWENGQKQAPQGQWQPPRFSEKQLAAMAAAGLVVGSNGLPTMGPKVTNNSYGPRP